MRNPSQGTSPTVYVPVEIDGPYSQPPTRAARIFIAVLCVAIFSAVVLAFGPGGFFFYK